MSSFQSDFTFGTGLSPNLKLKETHIRKIKQKTRKKKKKPYTYPK